MNKLAIKKNQNGYLIECDGVSYERRCLDEILEDTFVDVDYRASALNLFSALFQILDELVIIEENGNWLAFAPSTDAEKYRVEHVTGADVESYSLPEALISLLLSSVLYTVARRLPTLE